VSSPPGPSPDDDSPDDDSALTPLDDAEFVPDAEVVPDVEGQPGQQMALFMEQKRVHRGPLPPAEQLAQYEAVQAGFAERIMRMAEKEQAHRHEMTDVEVREPFRLARRGQAFAIGSMVLVLGFGVFLVLMGYAAAGAIIVGLDLVGLVALFITGEREVKSSPEDEASEPRSDEPDTPPADN